MEGKKILEDLIKQITEMPAEELQKLVDEADKKFEEIEKAMGDKIPSILQTDD